MTHLDRAIKHYRDYANGPNALQSHYALGALEVLEQIVELRDECRAEEKQLWQGRAHELVMTGFQYTKGFRRALDNIGVRDAAHKNADSTPTRKAATS